MELSFYFDKAIAVMSEFRKLNPPGNDVDYQGLWKLVPAEWTEFDPHYHRSGLHTEG